MKTIYVPMTVSTDLIPIKMEVAVDTVALSLGIGASISYHPAPPYDGDYVVTPSTDSDIVLPTDGKLMSSDVTVLEIPYAAVSNVFGGYTVTIGG